LATQKIWRPNKISTKNIAIGIILASVKLNNRKVLEVGRSWWEKNLAEEKFDDG